LLFLDIGCESWWLGTTKDYWVEGYFMPEQSSHDHSNHGHSKNHHHALHQRVCPWWVCFTFDNPLRRWLQNPYRILSPYVKKGWTVLDLGPGMGYFSIPLAKIVGDSGKVIIADLQRKMLDAVHSRAVKAGVQHQIIAHQAKPDSIGVSEPVDFALAFWMVHEVPNRKHFLNQIFSILKPNRMLLLVEPRLHVAQVKFEDTLSLAKEVGFEVVERPHIRISNAALLKKPSK
jgi:ubiquinone/menaquinone biosynthesis C-methylase UbiE